MDLLHSYSYNENKYYNTGKMFFFGENSNGRLQSKMRTESCRKVNG